MLPATERPKKFLLQRFNAFLALVKRSKRMRESLLARPAHQTRLVLPIKAVEIQNVSVLKVMDYIGRAV